MKLKDLHDFPNIINPLLGDSKFRSVHGGEGFLPEEGFVDFRWFILSNSPSNTILNIK